MTVAELIAKLQYLPSNMKVKVYEGECDDYVDIIRCEIYAIDSNNDRYIRLDTEWAINETRT